MREFSTAFIGAGNMAGSIIGGLVAAGFPAQQIRASDPSVENLERLRGQGVAQIGSDNAACAIGADVIILAVKPQVLQGVCESIAAVLNSDQVVVSIAAGVGADSLRGWLGAGPAIVRCMPNTPALLGAGASALYAHGAVTETQKERAQNVLEAVGLVRWVNEEDLIHAVTAVSGSGPAYFFQFMEAMIDEAERMGLNEETARTLCAQTCIGAGRMLLEGEHSAKTLRENVCSPGGTTERAVASFRAADLETMVAKAMRACQERSVELAAELA